LVTGAFDCVDDGPNLSGNDSPPKDKTSYVNCIPT
jgi:hypothetical protein